MQENKQEKSPIKRKILTFLSEMGISQYDFYRKTGITRGILSQNNGISEENIARFLAVYPQVSAEWLLTGRGNMLREEDGQLAQPTIAAQFPLRTDRQVEMQSIPLYELDASAGLVALFNETARQVPVSHLQIPDLPPCDGAIYVRGDSMYPLLKSGDIVLYKEGSKYFEWDSLGEKCICCRSRLTATGTLRSNIFRDRTMTVSCGWSATIPITRRKTFLSIPFELSPLSRPV